MLKSALTSVARSLSARSIVTTPARSNVIMTNFFDDEANFGKVELRPKKRPGRSWTQEELRLKANTDLHKLWYVCLKERNMLLTMKAAYSSRARSMPNQERIDRVNETMRNIEAVVHERNDAFYRLETGDGADPPQRTITSFMGFTYKKPAEEHYFPPGPNEKQYEVPYLDEDAYMMQKLWKEKEHMKALEVKDREHRRKVQTEEMAHFKRGGPRTFNRIE